MGGMAAQAQCGAENTAIKPGETLSYRLKFNWKFIWVNVGWAKMTVNTTTYKGQPCLQTDLLSFTKPSIDKFFKMRDTLTCITTEKLEPLYFRKGAEEGKRYTVDEVNFAYRNGKCIVDQQRSVNWGTPDKHHDEMPVCVYDMLSILLQARSYDPTDYRPGQKILFSMATGRAIEKQTLIYRRKENYEAENGVTYRCLVFHWWNTPKKIKKGSHYFLYHRRPEPSAGPSGYVPQLRLRQGFPQRYQRKQISADFHRQDEVTSSFRRRINFTSYHIIPWREHRFSSGKIFVSCR